jgi:hypothetical protein
MKIVHVESWLHCLKSKECSPGCSFMTNSLRISLCVVVAPKRGTGCACSCILTTTLRSLRALPARSTNGTPAHQTHEPEVRQAGCCLWVVGALHDVFVLPLSIKELLSDDRYCVVMLGTALTRVIQQTGGAAM